MKKMFLMHFIASAVILLTALGFQYVGGLAPCVLCVYQRLPYVGVMVLCVLYPRRFLLMGCYAVGFSLAVFHVGVEQHWWQGLATCGNAIVGDDIDAVLAAIQKAPITKCNEIAWSFFWLSMAAWNALLNLGLGMSLLLTRSNTKK